MCGQTGRVAPANVHSLTLTLTHTLRYTMYAQTEKAAPPHGINRSHRGPGRAILLTLTDVVFYSKSAVNIPNTYGSTVTKDMMLTRLWETFLQMDDHRDMLSRSRI